MRGRMSWLYDTLFGDQAGGTEEARNWRLPPDGSGVAMSCVPLILSIRVDSVPEA